VSLKKANPVSKPGLAGGVHSSVCQNAVFNGNAAWHHGDHSSRADQVAKSDRPGFVEHEIRHRVIRHRVNCGNIREISP
jgi:hypothetical protein